jgi:hypothetical protein
MRVCRSRDAARERPSPSPTILPDPVRRLEDERILSDTLGDRRKLSLLYKSSELGRLLEGLRELRRVGDDLGTLELSQRVLSGRRCRLSRRRARPALLLRQTGDEHRSRRGGA